MKNASICLVLVLLLLHVGAKAQHKPEPKKVPFSIGETVSLHSSILKEDRIINIYLPDSYISESKPRKYPVIYLLDGSRNEDFIHLAGLVQFGSFPWVNMLPESIVVGIANTDRKRDLTYPTRNKKDKKELPTSGGSASFIRFIEKELQPFIESNYRTDTVKTIVGQSLGGLLAAEILLKNPDLFTNYVIVSPSLWWDDESLLKYKPAAGRPGKAVYVAVGKEGAMMERATRELVTKLQNNQTTAVYFDFFEKQDHGNILHLAVYNAFEKLFKVSGPKGNN